MKPIRIDIWSDIACPWCHVGKRRLETALEDLETPVEIHWHAFELDPSAPKTHPPDTDYVAKLARKYRVTDAQAQGMIDRMVDTAAAEGLAFDFTIIRPGNTFDAHRLLHFAAERGLQGALKERFLTGYLCEGRAIGEREALTAMAVEVGLDADEVEGVLSSDAHAEAVRKDEGTAMRMGVSGVPFFVVDERYAISGAQPAELFTQIFEKVLGERPKVEIVAEGEVCGPDGCAVTPPRAAPA